MTLDQINDPAVQRALTLYIDKEERADADRAAWRQYACAALAGLASRTSTMLDVPADAAGHADAMVKLERERFDGGAK